MIPMVVLMIGKVLQNHVWMLMLGRPSEDLALSKVTEVARTNWV